MHDARHGEAQHVSDTTGAPFSSVSIAIAAICLQHITLRSQPTLQTNEFQKNISNTRQYFAGSHDGVWGPGLCSLSGIMKNTASRKLFTDADEKLKRQLLCCICYKQVTLDPVTEANSS